MPLYHCFFWQSRFGVSISVSQTKTHKVSILSFAILPCQGQVRAHWRSSDCESLNSLSSTLPVFLSSSDHVIVRPFFQWELICSRKHLKALSQAAYLAGLLIGSFAFSSISDHFGRKIAVFLSIAFLVSTTINDLFPLVLNQSLHSKRIGTQHLHRNQKNFYKQDARSQAFKRVVWHLSKPMHHFHWLFVNTTLLVVK